MSNPEKTTGISTEERRLRSARLKSRLMGLCEGFDAGASVDVKAQEEEISRLEQQLDAANQRIAELTAELDDLRSGGLSAAESCCGQFKRVLSDRAEAAERKLWSAREAIQAGLGLALAKDSHQMVLYFKKALAQIEQPVKGL